MTIYEQTLKALEAQFQIATDALVTQFEAATKVLLLAQEAAYKVKIHEFKEASEPVDLRAVEFKTQPPTVPPPFVVTEQMRAKMNEPQACAAVPVTSSPPPFIASPCPPGAAATTPRAFYAPAFVEQFTCAPTFAPLPELDEVGELVADEMPEEIEQARREYQIQTAEMPPVAAPPAFVPPPVEDVHAEKVSFDAKGVVHVAWAKGPARVIPLTAAPMPVKDSPPPFNATGFDTSFPVPLTAVPVTTPPAFHAPWVYVPRTQAVKLFAPAFVPCPPPAVQAPPPAPAKLGDPSRDPNRRAARFAPDTASRRSNRVSRLSDGGEPKLASVRSEELREAARPDLKALLHLVYVGPNGRPLMNYDDVIRMDKDAMVDAILDHEAAKGWITRDFAWRAA
jgi:hypothetical protein